MSLQSKPIKLNKNMGNEIHKQSKSYLTFNRFYIIESLDANEGDQYTGTMLLDSLRDVIQTRPCLGVEVFEIDTYADYKQLMSDILTDSQGGNSPIIHFEIHGADDMSGLYLNSGEIVQWREVLSDLTQINYACNCNLMATFAVCYGLHIAEFINTDRLMPFCMSVGSFKELLEDDLIVRYQEFYRVFLTRLNIDEAFDALVKANPRIDNEYSILKADVLFTRVQYGYLTTQCTRTQLKLRAESEIKNNPAKFAGMSKEGIRQFIKDFRRQERIKHEDYYLEGMKRYYNLNLHPENRDRFLIFDSTSDLVNAFNND